MEDPESSNDKTDVSVEHTSNFGFLTTQYELLYLILSCLPMQDLNSAACVCKSWYDACKIIKRERHSLHWLHWYLSSSPAANKAAKLRGKTKNSSNGSEEKVTLPVQQFVPRMLSDVYSEPKLCMLFASTALLDNQERFMFNNGYTDSETPSWQPKQGQHTNDHGKFISSSVCSVMFELYL